MMSGVAVCSLRSSVLVGAELLVCHTSVIPSVPSAVLPLQGAEKPCEHPRVYIGCPVTDLPTISGKQRSESQQFLLEDKNVRYWCPGWDLNPQGRETMRF